LLILKSEDFYEHPAATVERVVRFLGLPDQKIEIGRGRNEGDYTEPMDPETRRWLQVYYKPHNERLYEYLETDFRLVDFGEPIIAGSVLVTVQKERSRSLESQLKARRGPEA
jgi:hypothetical protein